MAIIKTYPLKNNYYGPDRLILSDMQPDSEGIVKGETKSLTLASLKSFIGTGSDAFTLTTTGTSGAATFNTNTKILNIPDYSVGNVDGSGTAGKIPKWQDSNTLEDSEIFQSGTNVGIGTTSPAFKLEVINTIGVSGLRPIRMNSATGAIDIRGSGTGGWANAFNFNGSLNTVLGGFGCLGLGDAMDYFYIGSAYNDTTLVIKPNNGNVGIGTTTPSQKLTVSGKGLFETGGSTPDSTIATYEKGITLTSGGAGNQRLVIDVSDVTNGGSYIQTRHQSTGFPDAEYALALNPLGGNVGIGTTTPTEKLDVVGNIKTSGRVYINGTANFIDTTRNASSQANYIRFYDSSTSAVEAYVGFTSNNRDFKIDSANGSGTLTLNAGGGTAVHVTSSQNVGIGTTAPNAKLHVQDTSGSTSQIRMSAASSNANYAFIKMEDVTANTSKLTLGATIGYAVEKPALTIFNSYTTLLGNGTSNGRLLFNCSANTHSVEIIGPDHSGGTSYSLKLPNSLPSVSNQILEANALGVLSWIPTPTGGGSGGGTLNTVGLSMPSFLTVGNSPLTGTGGTISVTLNGGSSGQFLDYQGNWSTPAAGTTSVTNGNPPASTGSALTISPNTGDVIVTSNTYAGTNNVGHVPAGGTPSTFLRGDGTWVTPTAALDFFKTIATPTNNVVASGNSDTLTLAAGGNTGIFINGSGSQVTIGLSAPTALALGGIKLSSSAATTDLTPTYETATAGTGINNRVYPVQLNSANQAGVYVPWSSGASGISFSGTTVGGLATFTNSSTAGVSSKVNLNASGLMDFDYDGDSAASIDYDPLGTRLKIGDFNGEGAIVELWTDGSRGFQVGVNGEIGVGTTSSQGTLGQVLTSQGSGDPAIWSNSGGNIANTDLTQTANRTYAMGTYALTMTGSSTVSMQNTNGLVVSGNIISNSQSYAAKNSISNKNTSFTIDCNDGNIQQVNLTNGSGNVIISFSNVRAGARYTVITTRLGFEGTYGTYSFNSVLWPNSSTPQNVPAGSGTFNMYEFVATTTASSGMLGYFFRNYQTVS